MWVYKHISTSLLLPLSVGHWLHQKVLEKLAAVAGLLLLWEKNGLCYY